MKTSFLVTIDHADDINIREIEKVMEKMAQSFGHLDVKDVEITAAEQLTEQ